MQLEKHIYRNSIMPSESEQTNTDASTGADILKAVGSTRSTIDWQRSMPWWYFLSGFVRLGWRTSHVVLAMLGIWLSELGMGLAHFLFRPSAAGLISNPALAPGQGSDVSFLVNMPGFSIPSAFTSELAVLVGGPLSLQQIGYLIVVVIWLGLVWGFVGGVITRRSVVELGARTTIGWVGAVKLVTGRLRSIVEAAALPAIAVLAICAIPMLLGILARLGAFGEVLSAFGMLLSVVLVIPVAWLLILCVLGFPIVVAAIVTEKDSDVFDGLSRAAAYLFQRPVTLLIALVVGGSIIGLVVGIVGSVYQSAFGLMTQFYFAAAGLGNGQAGMDSERARSLFETGGWVVDSLVLAIGVSLFWSAVSATYLILRREVDQTDYDELDLQEMGSPLALPPTNYSQSGVLEVGSPDAVPIKNSPATAAPPPTVASEIPPVAIDGAPENNPVVQKPDDMQ